jgi:uncharacterized Tic20 family protein
MTHRRHRKAALSELRDSSRPQNGLANRNSVAIAGSGAVVLAVLAMVTPMWLGVGDSHISFAGWFAMLLGVLVTLALGIGLMALVFISNRRDDLGQRDDYPTK